MFKGGVCTAHQSCFTAADSSQGLNVLLMGKASIVFREMKGRYLFTLLLCSCPEPHIVGVVVLIFPRRNLEKKNDNVDTHTHTLNIVIYHGNVPSL